MLRADDGRVGGADSADPRADERATHGGGSRPAARGGGDRPAALARAAAARAGGGDHPYADRLTFPSGWLRTRRDYARFLNLIEVSAFLHQHQRARSQDAIVATPADYQVAYDLAAEVLADTLAELKKPLRAVLEAVNTLASTSGEPVTRRAVREQLQCPDSSLRNWLNELVSLEYLDVDCAAWARRRATGWERGRRASGRCSGS